METRTQDLPSVTLCRNKEGLALNVRVADSFRSRSRGLAGFGVTPRPDVALWLKRTRSVHTVGMRFELDLVWLDRLGLIIRVDEGVKPRRVMSCLGASSVIELTAGSASRLGLTNGARLTA